MEELLFSVTIPGRCYVKKNGQKVVSTWRYGMQSKRKINTVNYNIWAARAVPLMIIARDRQLKRTIDCDIRCKMIFYFKNHQAEADLSALYEGPQDELKKAQVIKDDKFVQSHDGSRKIFGDSNERTEIEIYRFTQ